MNNKQILIWISVICFLIFNPSLSIGQQDKDTLLRNYIQLLIQYQRKQYYPGDTIGMPKEVLPLIDSIQTFGTTAIPDLLKLLENPSFQVRERASFALSGIDGLNESHVDLLIKSLNRGQSWHANKVAEIGTPKAVDAIIQLFLKEKEKGTPNTRAFVKLGKKGIPVLIDCIIKKNHDEELMYVVADIFEEMGPDAYAAFFKLDSLVKDPHVSKIVKKISIQCLGLIGEPALPSAEYLLTLAKKDSALYYKIVSEALLGMKSPLAVNLKVNMLKKSLLLSDKVVLLRDIAQLQELGYEAGSAILPYLDDEIWSLRIAAVRTIGFIKYTPAEDKLIECLNYEPNCKLNYTAAIALAHIKSSKAIPALENVARNHWYPVVRRMANLALNYIRDTSFFKEAEKYLGMNYYSFPARFFSYNNMGVGVPFCRYDSCNLNKYLLLTSGKLIGTDYGEFGGDLKFINSTGKETVVLKKRIKSILMMGENLIVITGIDHMGANIGEIFQILFHHDGSITSNLLHVLPNTPMCIRTNQYGGVYISTYSGTVELTKELKLKFVDCSDFQK